MLDYAKRKFKALCMPLDESIWDRYVLKVVGQQDYLLHRDLPLYMYDCVTRAATLNVRCKINFRDLAQLNR